MAFIPAMQSWLNMQNSINVTPQCQQSKNKNCMIISINAEKLLTKLNTHSRRKKSPPKTGTKWNLFNPIKGSYKKPTADMLHNGERWTAACFRPQIRSQGRGSALTLSLSLVLEALASRQSGCRKGDQHRVEGSNLENLQKYSPCKWLAP